MAPTTAATTLSFTVSGDVPSIYSLRENPRKTIKFTHPDCESEVESRDDRCGSAFRKRRSRGICRDDGESHETEPVSSVSDTSLVPEEDVAMWLMMLCRDDGRKKAKEGGGDSDAQRKVHQCEICRKWFRSSQALGGHRIIHRKAQKDEKIIVSGSGRSNRKIFECSFCGKVFGSGQALGGHKRSHLMGKSGQSSSSAGITTTTTTTNSYIDLNLPASTEDEDVYSVVSDDCGGCNTN